MCSEFNRILIVADGNTYAAAGKKAEAHLSGKKISRLIFSGETVLVPDEKAVAAVREQLDGIELIIGVGSGVIQDLCKYISHFDGIPYYIVATAPSMDGYASSGAAMISEGMKVTYSAKVPDGFIGDTEILKNAPIDMIKAGYGDIVGKYSSLNDWKLSHAVTGEYFCDHIYDLTLEAVGKTLPLSQRLLEMDGEAVKTLTEALITAGVAMSYAGSSRPASGSEHHLSHFFEITGLLNGEKYLPHGIDVAYSTVITACIRERLALAFSEKQYGTVQASRNSAEIKRIFGGIADKCIALHQRTKLYDTDRLSVYKERSAEIKEILSEIPSAAEIEVILSDIGLDMQSFYNTYPPSKLRDAVAYAKDLKDRYTVLWMYYDILGNEKNL